MKKILVIFLLVVTVSFVNAQGEEEKQQVFEFSSGVDLVSGFIWRGLDFGRAPAIQPNVAIGAFGF